MLLHSKRNVISGFGFIKPIKRPELGWVVNACIWVSYLRKAVGGRDAMDTAFGGTFSPLDVLALPTARAKRIAPGPEFHRPGAGAFEDVGHDPHAAGVVGGDVGDVLGEGVE